MRGGRKLGDKKGHTHILTHPTDSGWETGEGSLSWWFIPQTKHASFAENGGGRGFNKPYLYLCNMLGTVPMGISHALSRSLNSVGGVFLFSLNYSDLISICLKTGTNTQCDCKSSFT
jgi:hypothetical protein